jgi:hypothetical protein
MELLYLDQNYLSGIVKRKVAFRELEPALRAAVARGVVAVPESETHRLESAARPDLPLLALLRELSGGLTLPHERGAVERHCERRLEAVLERDFPERRSRASDRLDMSALAVALPRCDLITCDAFMADVVRRTGLDVRFGCELFTGRRADVERLRRRLEPLTRALPPQRRDRLNGPIRSLAGRSDDSQDECAVDSPRLLRGVHCPAPARRPLRVASRLPPRRWGSAPRRIDCSSIGHPPIARGAEWPRG